MKDKQSDKQLDSMTKGTPTVMSDYPSALPQLNCDDYKEELAELKLNEAQAQELLQTLWNIMAAFVDLGWGVDGVQAVLPDLFENTSHDSKRLIDSIDTEKKREE